MWDFFSDSGTEMLSQKESMKKKRSSIACESYSVITAKKKQKLKCYEAADHSSVESNSGDQEDAESSDEVSEVEQSNDGKTEADELVSVCSLLCHIMVTLGLFYKLHLVMAYMCMHVIIRGDLHVIIVTFSIHVFF